MSNKYKILELLKQNGLTIKEISDKTEFNENEVRVYIHRLKDNGLIREIGKKNRYIIYIAIKKGETNIDVEILKKMIPEFIKKGNSYRIIHINMVKVEIYNRRINPIN